MSTFMKPDACAQYVRWNERVSEMKANMREPKYDLFYSVQNVGEKVLLHLLQ
jgi:hypothetical protein